RITNSTGTAATLNVGDNNATSTYAGSIAGPINLTKIGSGTLTLNGGLLYTGATTVRGGTVSLGFSSVIANSSALNITNAALTLVVDPNRTNISVTTLTAGGAT